MGIISKADGWAGDCDCPAQPVAFEAKETTGKEGRPETNFPLYVRNEDMIKEHQREFLKNWDDMGGLSFVLIHFKNRGECYATPVDFINEWYIQAEAGGRKSIPFGEFNQFWRVDVEDYLELL